MARKRHTRSSWRNIFKRVAKLCKQRARKGLVKYQTCMKHELRKYR